MSKIAIVQTDLGIGGIERSLINLLNNIDYKKNQVDLYLYNLGELSEELTNKVNVIKLKPVNKNKMFLGFKYNYKSYKLDIKKEYDIAIDFNGYNMHTAITALKLNAKKHVIWVHNDYLIKSKHEYKFKIIYKLNKKKFKLFDEIVCVSNGVKNSFKELTKLDANYTVIPNYINTKHIIDSSKVKTNLKMDETKLNFVCLGRLVYQKGYDDLLIKFAKVLEFRKDVHLYFIGEGEERRTLEMVIEALNLKDYVTLLGSKENPYAYLKDMDVLLFNSRYEGQGMVVLEALTLGLQVIIKEELEQYLDNIKGTNDMIKAMVEAKKCKKSINTLDDYNGNITKSIKTLIGEK